MPTLDGHRRPPHRVFPYGLIANRLPLRCYARQEMSADIIGRHGELQIIASFLDSIRDGPAALILRGEAGIGKTTLWEAGLGEASRRGYRLLSCRPVESEAPLSYTSLTDLLAGVGEELVSDLPVAQRQALEVALLRGPPAGPTPDHRAIATALLTVLHTLSDQAPVLVGVDDLQWLDGPSARALEFVVRRLMAPIGILVSFRTAARAWNGPQLRLPNPDRVGRLEIGP